MQLHPSNVMIDKVMNHPILARVLAAFLVALLLRAALDGQSVSVNNFIPFAQLEVKISM